MGCDYYIIKQLRIEHSDGVDIIELDRDRGYFSENYDNDNDSDSDDTIQEDYMNKYQHYLKVTFTPRILCENTEWKSEKIRDKYIDIVYDKLKHYNNAFSNINLIIKEEVRYLR
jgi:hypothetical protein